MRFSGTTAFHLYRQRPDDPGAALFLIGGL
jgi:hypothetical protein